MLHPIKSQRVQGKGKKRIANDNSDIMEGSYLGPEFSTSDIIRSVKKFKAVFKKYGDFEMDWLVMGNLVFDKKCQPEWNEKKDWRLEYELD